MPQGSLLGYIVQQFWWWYIARLPLPECQISSHSDNQYTRYLLSKFVDFIDGLTDNETKHDRSVSPHTMRRQKNRRGELFRQQYSILIMLIGSSKHKCIVHRQVHRHICYQRTRVFSIYWHIDVNEQNAKNGEECKFCFSVGDSKAESFQRLGPLRSQTTVTVYTPVVWSPLFNRARQLYKNISMLFLFPVERDLLFTNI